MKHTQSHTHSFTLERRVALFVILIPFVAFLFAIFYFWNRGLSPLDFSLMMLMYIITGLGITAGFHRYFTHNSFQAPIGMALFLGIAGSMAVQGPLLLWASAHRRHHQYSDMEGDPHSPHLSGNCVWGALKGLWLSHVGWMLKYDLDDWILYVPDLARNRLTYWIHKTYMLWILMGIAFPALIGGLFTLSWQGAFTAGLWAGLVRIFFVHHITWSVNSICHYYGSYPYKTNDESRNNFWVALLSFGEGWHNNHHAFPTSARHGLWWWQIDFAYMFIVMLSYFGLTSNVKLPKPEALHTKRHIILEPEPNL